MLGFLDGCAPLELASFLPEFTDDVPFPPLESSPSTSSSDGSVDETATFMYHIQDSPVKSIRASPMSSLFSEDEDATVSAAFRTPQRELTKVELEDSRLARNRESAAQSRKRKQQELNELEDLAAQLRRDEQALRKQNDELRQLNASSRAALALEFRRLTWRLSWTLWMPTRRLPGCSSPTTSAPTGHRPTRNRSERPSCSLDED